MIGEISIHARTKNGSICKFMVEVHEGHPTDELQADLFGVPPFTFEDAQAALVEHLEEIENHKPRVVLACLPGGKK